MTFPLYALRSILTRQAPLEGVVTGNYLGEATVATRNGVTKVRVPEGVRVGSKVRLEGGSAVLLTKPSRKYSV